MKLLNLMGCIAFTACLFSCDNTDKKTSTAKIADSAVTEKQVVKPKNKPLPPTAGRTTTDFTVELQANFTKEQIAFLKSIETDFNAIANASEMSVFYHEKLPKVLELMNKKINQYDPEMAMTTEEINNKWDWFTAYMPYVKVALFCSECSTESYIVLNPLRDKAEVSKGKEDDTFFGALLTAYKIEDNKDEVICDKVPNNWVKLVNCDLCGTDILGNSKHLNTLQAINTGLKTGNLFEKDLKELWEQALPAQSTNYYHSKEVVLKELELIINTVDLSKKEKENLKNLRYLISVGKNIQFDCQKGNCQFMAM